MSKPLEILFNVSFSLGEVPSSFKIAKIIPVHKGGSSSCLNNYRPNSLLCIFNKLLEKLMYNRLIDFLDMRNMLYEKQFGFRANHSTNHAILSIIDKIQLSIEERSYSCGIFLEFNTVTCGIPHGSVLGPLLFLMYINDFNRCSEILDFHLFADNSNLFYKQKNLVELQTNLNRELHNIHVWLHVC